MKKTIKIEQARFKLVGHIQRHTVAFEASGRSSSEDLRFKMYLVTVLIPLFLLQAPLLAPEHCLSLALPG